MGVIGITLILASLALLFMYPQKWRSLAQPVLQWWQAETPAEAPSERTATTTPAPTAAAAPAISETDRDRLAMPPPPPPMRMPEAKMEEDEDEEATTPKAVPTVVRNGAPVPSLALSAPGEDDDEDGDDTENIKMPPPMFPSPFSAQRASASSDPSKTASSAGRMAPPPRPQLRAPGTASLSALNAARRPQTLPIPNRGPPLRSLAAPASSASSLAPPPSSTTKPNKPSRKVILEPGHSPLDWARLTADPTGNRLRGDLPANAPYPLRVTPSQLKQMNGRKGRDAWTALGGMVYNISPYVPFHPGGKGELLRCAGKDGNRLFNEVHSWVNYDNMLAECRIGILVEEHASTTSPMEEMD